MLIFRYKLYVYKAIYKLFYKTNVIKLTKNNKNFFNFSNTAFFGYGISLKILCASLKEQSGSVTCVC